MPPVKGYHVLARRSAHRNAATLTPTNRSWLNLVERWFGELTQKKIRRGTHASVRDLQTDIRDWTKTWNENPRPYVWTKTADEILAKLAAFCTRTSDSTH